MPLIPTTPSVSGVTTTQALINKGVDGNGASTYYSFQLTYNVNLTTQLNYLAADGSFSPIPVWHNVTMLLATALIPNTLFSVRLAAADDALGTNATSYGPPATFTTAAAQPLSQPYRNIYSTTWTATWLPNFNNDTTEYSVVYSTDPSFVFNVVTSPWITNTSFTVIDALPNTIYYSKVQSRNSVLFTSPFTTLGAVTTPIGPAQVQGTRATNLLANRGFIIQWSANVEPNIAYYRVYRSSSPTDNSSFYIIGTTPNNVTSFVDNVPFTFGITWYYKVTALDTGNNESSLDLTNPVQDMTFSQFVEQPFPTSIEVGDLVNGEIPSGALDGVNTVYTTSNPFKTSTLSVYFNGVKLMANVDYFVNIPQQFTLVSAPLSTDYIRVDYLKY